MSRGGQLRKKAQRASGIPASPIEKYAVCVDGLVRIVNFATKMNSPEAIQLAGVAFSTLELVGLKLMKKESENVTNNATDA